MEINKFGGDTYRPEHDHARLQTQLLKVKTYMGDHEWHTIKEVAQATQSPEASVSGQFRALRMRENGGHEVSRRVKGDRKSGLYEYKLEPKVVDESYFLREIARREGAVKKYENFLEHTRNELELTRMEYLEWQRQ